MLQGRNKVRTGACPRLCPRKLTRQAAAKSAAASSRFFRARSTAGKAGTGAGGSPGRRRKPEDLRAWGPGELDRRVARPAADDQQREAIEVDLLQAAGSHRPNVSTTQPINFMAISEAPRCFKRHPPEYAVLAARHERKASSGRSNSRNWVRSTWTRQPRQQPPSSFRLAGRNHCRFGGD